MAKTHIHLPLIETALNDTSGNPITASNPLPVTAISGGGSVYDTNLGPTGVNTLRTSSNIARNGNELSYGSGLADANTLRVVLPTDQTPIPITPLTIASEIRVRLEDVAGTGITSTFFAGRQTLDVNIADASFQIETGESDKTAYIYGTSINQTIGGVYQDTATTLLAGESGAIRLTQSRAFHTNLRNDSGAEIGTSSSPLRIDPTGTTPQPASQSGTWNINNITGTVSLPTGAATLAEQQTQTIRLTSIRDAVEIIDDWDESDRAKVNLIVGQAGVAAGPGTTTASTQRVVIVTDQTAIPTTQSGTWNINDITGTVSLPTGASTSALQITGNILLASIDTKVSTLAEQQTQTTRLTSIRDAVEIIDDWDESDRAKVNLIVGQAGVAAGAGTTGANTQRVVIVTDQTSIPAIQSGTWNITNITGTISLPTGASTSANQTTEISLLTSIDGKMNSLGQKTMSASMPVVMASDQKTDFDIPDQAGVESALTVGTSAVEIRVGGSRLANRKSVTLYNNAFVNMFWGYTSGVTTTTGTPITPGTLNSWASSDNNPIYVITTLAGQNSRITEA